MKLWDAATGALFRTFEVQEGESLQLRSHPMETACCRAAEAIQLREGNDNTLKLWIPSVTGVLLRTFEGHLSSVSSISFSPDGKQVLSGSADLTIKIWNVETGEQLVSMLGQRDGEWIAALPIGFFSASPKGSPLLGVVRGLEAYDVDQMYQSLYSPDLVRESLAGDPDGEVKKAAEELDLEKVLDSGKAPEVVITSPQADTALKDEVITAEAACDRSGRRHRPHRVAGQWRHRPVW